MSQMCPACSQDNPDGAFTCSYCAERLLGLLGSNTSLASRYRVSRVLGCGGMGAVYLADDMRISGRLVAIKESLNPANQAQFQAEIRVMTGLQHPGLPAISDQFLNPNGRQYLVMDFIAGDDLDAVVARRGRLPEAEVQKLALDLLDTLEHLHSLGVVHRDIKPANIKFNLGGKPVLVDFGIAKQWAHGSKTQPWAQGMGSPGFAPAEQYGGGTDQRSDLYSLGAVLYFLLTTQTPPEASQLAAGLAVLTPPSQYQPGLSSDMQRVVFKAMAPDPAHRYQTAAEMRLAVQRVGQGAGSGQATPPISSGVPSSGARGLPWTRLAVTGVALVILLMAIRLIGGRSRSAATPTPAPVAFVVKTETAIPATSTATPTFTPIPATPTPRPIATPKAIATWTPRSATPTPRRPTRTPTPRPRAEIVAAVDVRTGPGAAYPVLIQAHSGERLMITGRNQDCSWFQVAVAGGRTGWVGVDQVSANVPQCSPLAVADPPLPTATSPPPPKPTPVKPTAPPPSLANNVSQFGNVQGGNGWWYQVEKGRNSGVFEDFPRFEWYGNPPRNCWQTNQEQHVRICEQGEVHPGVTGRIAYRWRSDAGRSVRAVVHAHKIDTACGDGVWIGVYHVPEGRPPAKVGEFTISGSEYRDRPANTYSYGMNLNAGDAVMVMMDIYRESGCDQTRLYVTIN